MREVKIVFRGERCEVGLCGIRCVEVWCDGVVCGVRSEVRGVVV